GSSPTIARRCPISRLNRGDFPTFGRPTIAISGNVFVWSDVCCSTLPAGRVSDLPEFGEADRAMRAIIRSPTKLDHTTHERFECLKGEPPTLICTNSRANGPPTTSNWHQTGDAKALCNSLYQPPSKCCRYTIIISTMPYLPQRSASFLNLSKTLLLVLTCLLSGLSARAQDKSHLEGSTGQAPMTQRTAAVIGVSNSQQPNAQSEAA